ncbi:MAG: hypothetical protein ACFB10_21095 [Salibacteraceae bacterium]
MFGKQSPYAIFRLSVVALVLLISTSWTPGPGSGCARIGLEMTSEVYYLDNNRLKFCFQEKYNYNSNLVYDILDDQHNVLLAVNPTSAPPSNFLVPHRIGDNVFDLNLSSLTLASGRYYWLRVEANKGDVYYLKFKTP